MGSIRDVLFVSINNQLAFASGSLESNYLVTYLLFIENYSIGTLKILKWVLTILFTGLFWIFGFVILKKTLGNKQIANYYTGIYILFFALAGIAYIIGYALNMNNLAYELSRGIMGGLQSPIPMLIFIPVLLLKKQQ